ncbi:MAG: hypothetical protein DWQ05_22630 [Calditrichaeota bacterium]|nr:MAG: hypothetical protein DWQ05_22630 [Calditrichota bacterium]
MSLHDENFEQNWVKQLHNRSWEMELLIVGFALLVLMRVPESLIEFLSPIESTVSNPFIRGLIPLGFTLIVATYIMSFNLGIHIILRGYWIGIVGLNSVFPDGVNIEKLNFHPRFADYLKSKLHNLAETALRIDKICSAIFAFTFLLIFIFISLAFYLLSMVLILSPITLLPEGFKQSVGQFYVLIVLFVYIILGLLSAADFLSLGLFKKIKKGWFARPYYWLSRYFRFITGFTFYQSIYYTLISNVPRKIIATILSVYLFITIGFFITRYDETIYFPKSGQMSAHRVLQKHYLDSLDPEHYIKSPIIPGKFVNTGFIELFIPYQITENDSLQKYCDGILPLKSIGFSFKGTVVFNVDSSRIRKAEKAQSEENIAAILDCVAKLYEISIDDSIVQEVHFLFYNHPHSDEPGYLTAIPTEALNPGLHRLTIRKKYDFSTDKKRLATTFHIPFWVVR